MPTFEPGAVVKIPFPSNNRDLSQARPALVVADRLNAVRRHLADRLGL